MKIEIITIGDELLIGQIVDTNSAWMARELTEYGFEIVAITTVGDNAQMIEHALNIGFGRADVLLLTGGVGPTKDDITKNTLCRYFHTQLVFNEEVLNTIHAVFSHKNLDINELTRSQVFVPEGCTVIPNKVGTAPILWFERDGKILVSMPGVPFEMKTAMIEEIIPRLQQHFRAETYLKRSFLVSDISESALAIKLSDFEKELPKGLSLAYLPSFGIVRLRLWARGKEHAVLLQQQAEKLISILGDLLVAEGDAPLEELLGNALRKKRFTVSTAESCTGGYIAHRITTVAGASDYFKGSIVAYSNEVKSDLLHVAADVLEKHGAVSRPVVEQMASSVASLLKTDCSIAVSGIAGPSGGTDEKPVGTVWICTRCNTAILSKLYHTGTIREENISRTANMGMLQLLKMLK
ncbi:MAG: CinA family nicotinamide mononucleotide deamidase-related protein [Dysgonamonadaceae bacterium]